MTFTKSIKATFPGGGICDRYGSVTGATANIGATTVVLAVASTASATLIPINQPLSNGIIRVRSSTIGAGATAQVGAITATDGTTTVQLYAGDGAASAAGVGVERLIEFCTNLALNSFSVVYTVATANSTVDIEIAGNS